MDDHKVNLVASVRESFFERNIKPTGRRIANKVLEIFKICDDVLDIGAGCHRFVAALRFFSCEA